MFKIALEAVRSFKRWDDAITAVGLTGDPAQDLQRA